MSALRICMLALALLAPQMALAQTADCGPISPTSTAEVELPAHYYSRTEHLASSGKSGQNIAITIWRSKCLDSQGKPQLWMRLSSLDGRTVTLPKFTITQSGRTIGSFGLVWTQDASCVMLGEFMRDGLDWDHDRLAGFNVPYSRPILPTGATVPWDPSQAFNLAIEYPVTAPSTSACQNRFVTQVVAHTIPAGNAPGNHAEIPRGIAGQWWNPADPGWGLVLDRNERGTVYAAWLTYDTNGETTWFAMTYSAADPAGGVSGDVYRHSGPAFSAPAITTTYGSGLGSYSVTLPAGKHATGERIGRFRLEFTDEDHGVLHVQLGDVIQRHPIQRLAVLDGSGNRCKGTRGTWLVGNADSGWGIGLEGDAGNPRCNLHMNFITYDAFTQPIWFFGGLSSPGRAGEYFRLGPVYRPTGRPYNAPTSARQFDLGNAVGSVKLYAFGTTGSSTVAQVEYDILGHTRSYTMQKLTFNF